MKLDHLTTLNIVLAILGMVIYVLMKLSKIQVVRKEKFSFRYWFRRNWINTALSICSCAAILLMLDDIVVFLGISVQDERFYSLTAFMAGYLNQSFFRNLESSFSKRTGGADTPA